MNILIVTAHPSTQGLTHVIAQRYAKASMERGHQVEILDLYTTPLKQDFLEFENKESSLDTEDRRAMQEKITWAHELVFIHPLWWGGPPAILKNWLDVNLSSPFAYTYTKRGPEGRLRGKQGRVFITGGASWWVYCCLLFPFLVTWAIIVFQFCGMKTKSLVYFGSKPMHTKEEIEKWLCKVDRIARKNSVR